MAFETVDIEQGFGRIEPPYGSGGSNTRRVRKFKDGLTRKMGDTGLRKRERRKHFLADDVVNLKYPESVGEDFNSVINYNTHQSSEYAKLRNSDKTPERGIDEEAYEPFMFFEFLELISEEKLDKFKEANDKNKEASKALGQNIEEMNNVKGETEAFKDAKAQVFYNWRTEARKEFADAAGVTSGDLEGSSWKDIFDKAKRVYGGSIALYMPTDIAINDTIVYNEESRKIAGILQGADEMDKVNATSATSSTFLGAMGGGLGWLVEAGEDKKWMPKSISKILGKGTGVLGGAGAAQVIGPETQRHTGYLLNPHEYMAYQSTGMRNFTFNWTFLPDNENESESAVDIIKKFRMAAHAKREDALRISVPDHLIVSFHGAADMIQLPPLVIESVGVTYNPNNASYFKHNNSPVEINLTVTLKEIVPIYKHDVEAGF